jgi:hypothetical protein
MDGDHQAGWRRWAGQRRQWWRLQGSDFTGLPNTLILQSFSLHYTYYIICPYSTHMEWTENRLRGSVLGQPCDKDPTSCSREHFKPDSCCCNAPWSLGSAQFGTMGKSRRRHLLSKGQLNLPVQNTQTGGRTMKF